MLGRISALDYTFATLGEAMSVMFAGVLLDTFDLSPALVCYVFATLAFGMFLFWFIFDRKGGGAANELSSEYEENDEYELLI